MNATDIVVTDPKQVTGTLSYDASTDSVTFTPSAPLVADSTYTVNISGVKSSGGTALSSPFQAKFATVMPPPPPPPSGGGGGTGGGGSSAPVTQFQAPLTPEIGLGTAFNGQVTVDTAGNTTVKLTGAGASTSYTLQFCPGFDAGATTIPAPSCFNVTTITTDASGNGSATAMFPKPGNWAGDFFLNDSTGKAKYQTYLTSGVNVTYMAVLLPDTTTNGGAVTTSSKQEPLTSGTVTYSKNALQFTLKGASPKTTYYTSSSETVYMDSSGTYQLSTFTTDANGDGSSTTTESSPGGDLFQVGPTAMPPTTAGFIGGFAVP